MHRFGKIISAEITTQEHNEYSKEIKLCALQRENFSNAKIWLEITEYEFKIRYLGKFGMLAAGKYNI